MSNQFAESQGFTQQVLADSTEYTLSLLVRPDTEYDSTFQAWDLEEQEWLNVSGWLFTIEEE